MYKKLSTNQLAGLIVSTVVAGLCAWPILEISDYHRNAYIGIFSILTIVAVLMYKFITPRNIYTYGLSYTAFSVPSVFILMVAYSVQVAFLSGTTLFILCMLNVASLWHFGALYYMYQYHGGCDQTHFEATLNKV